MTTWDELCDQAESLMHKLRKPAAPLPAFQSFNPEDHEYELETYEGADALVLESEAEDIYLGYKPCPPEMIWARGLDKDDFIHEYLAHA